jgi:hypothetical protein
MFSWGTFQRIFVKKIKKIKNKITTLQLCVVPLGLKKPGEFTAFNAQGSRLIIVVLHVGAVKTYAATVEALNKKERQGETELTTKTEVPTLEC